MLNEEFAVTCASAVPSALIIPAAVSVAAAATANKPKSRPSWAHGADMTDAHVGQARHPREVPL